MYNSCRLCGVYLSGLIFGHFIFRMATSYSFDPAASISENFNALMLNPNGAPSTSRLHLGLCPMCANAMTEERLLPCSHSICGVCVNAHLWSPILVCPICRSEHPLEHLLGGLYNVATSSHSSMEKILLNLIHTSNGDIRGSIDTRRNFSGDSNSTSSSNSTHSTVTHSPLITPNGNGTFKCNEMSVQGGAIPKKHHSGTHSFSNSFPSKPAKEPHQMLDSFSMFNEIFTRKDASAETTGKVPPLSPIVGGETRHNRLSMHFGPKNNSSPPPARETQSDVPCCLHGPSMVEYYCTICNLAFCVDCHSGHKTHRFAGLHDAENVVRGLLHELLNEAHSREKDVDESFATLKSLAEGLEVNAMIAEKEMNVLFHKIRENVEDRKKQLLDQMQRVRNLKTDALLKQMSTLKGAKSHLQSMQREITAKMRSREARELICAHVAASEALRRTERIALDLNPHEDAALLFHADMKDLTETIDRFGRFHSMGCPTNTLLFGIGTEVALINTPTHFSVHCVNYSGERRSSGGDDIVASLTYPSGKRVPIPITDYNDGDYTGMYISNERGEHVLHVTLRGAPVVCSGKKIQVKYRRPYKDLHYPPLDIFGKNPTEHPKISRGWGVHCDRDGTIFVTERDIHCVLVYGPDLRLRFKFGRYGDRDGEMNRPAGITVDVSRRIIVVDKDNHRIQLFTLDGRFLKRFGRRGSGKGEFQYPWDVDTNAKGQIAVSDSRNHRVQLFDKDGILLKIYEESSAKVNYKALEIPRGVCFDNHGNLLVADFNNHHVMILSPQLQFINVIGRYGELDGQFFRPQGVYVDPKGYIFVAESKTGRVQIFSPNRKFFGRITSTDREMKAFSPCDVTMSPDGFLFVVDIELGCVYKF